MKNLFILFFGFLPFSLIAQLQSPVIDLVQVAPGFNRPVDIANANDDRLFVVEQDGRIRIIDGTGSVMPAPFLDIDPIVGSGGNEQGLLGLAFHPNYSANGYFYVNYTNNSGNTRVSRFSVTADPNVADPGSELVIYAFNQDFSNHNGGDLNFGPNDGFLYIGTGDGGSGGDPNNRAQNPMNAQGKMIRIDVDNPSGGNNYGIPASNPFVGDNTVLPEIWALGLRNPWRFSFDRLTHDMYIGDVGQGAWEEIDFQPASSTGGENYGWRCYEGNNTFNTSGCGPAGNYTFPIHEYESNFPDGCSITGGYVYRGSQYPNLYGKYIYADYCAGNFWYLEPDGAGGWTNTFLTNEANFEYSSFGEDQDGELYVAALDDGIIYQVVELCTGFTVTSSASDETCLGDSDGTADLTIEGGAGSIEVNWSNGSQEVDQDNLTTGVYSATIVDDNGCTLVETVEISNSTPEAPVITASGPTDVCFGVSVTLTSTAAPLGSSIQWYETETLIPGAVGNTLVLDEVASGMYNAVFTGGPCPSGVSNVIEVNILPVPETPVITQNGNTLIGPVAAGYQWYLDGMIIDGATSQNYTAEATGSYTLEVFNAAQCSSTSAPIDLLTLSANAPSELIKWEINPTPFRQSVHLEISLITQTHVSFRITDVSGRIVYEADLGEVSFVDQTIDLSGFPAGLFIAEIRTDSGGVVKKLIKE